MFTNTNAWTVKDYTADKLGAVLTKEAESTSKHGEKETMNPPYRDMQTYTMMGALVVVSVFHCNHQTFVQLWLAF